MKELKITKQTLNTKEELQKRIEEINITFKSNSSEYLELLRFQSRFYNYSSRNTKLIYSQNSNVMFVGSYKKWQELGYNVLKGQKGIKVLIPTPIKYIRANEEYIKYSEATKEQQKLSTQGKLETKSKMSFKVGNVFDIMQTNCPKSDYPKLLIGHPSVEHDILYKAVKHYAESILNVPINERNLNSLALRGLYSPIENKIEHNSILESTQKLSTTIHEIAHSILHNNTKVLEIKPVAQIELEADSLSLMIHERLGLEITSAHQSHLISQYENLKLTDNQDKIVESLDNVSNTYNDMISEFTETLNKYLSNNISNGLRELQSNEVQEISKETFSYELEVETECMSME